MAAIIGMKGSCAQCQRLKRARGKSARRAICSQYLYILSSYIKNCSGKSDGKNITVNFAKNPTTLPEILALLAMSVEVDVREGVAENGNTPANVFLILSRDDNWNVRVAVAENGNTPADVFLILSRDDNWKVRVAVAGNENISQELRFRLLMDDDRDVTKAASLGLR